MNGSIPDSSFLEVVVNDSILVSRSLTFCYSSSERSLIECYFIMSCIMLLIFSTFTKIFCSSVIDAPSLVKLKLFILVFTSFIFYFISASISRSCSEFC